MNNGTYGTVRLADVDVSDITIVYTYNKNNYTTDDIVAKELNAFEVLSQVMDSNKNPVYGLYTLKLPEDIFSEIGIYNILLKPKTFTTVIQDIGVLSSRSDIKGMVIDLNNPSLASVRNKLVNGGLDGYRIEYIKNNNKIKNTFRIVTSSNKCELVNDITSSTSQKIVRYRFNDYSNLMFLTLTPSSNSEAKINSDVFIGDVGDTIEFSNTFFDPILLEVEIVNTTLETLRHGIYGSQTEDRDGRFVIYTDDEDRMPYREYNIYTEKDEYNKIKTKIKENIDISDGTSFDDYKNTIG